MIITINAGEIYTPSPGSHESGFRLIGGMVWLTTDGCSQDQILSRGDEAAFGGDRKVILEALGGPASLEIVTARELVGRKNRRPLRSCA